MYLNNENLYKAQGHNLPEANSYPKTEPNVKSRDGMIDDMLKNSRLDTTLSITPAKRDSFKMDQLLQCIEDGQKALEG